MDGIQHSAQRFRTGCAVAVEAGHAEAFGQGGDIAHDEALTLESSYVFVRWVPSVRSVRFTAARIYRMAGPASRNPREAGERVRDSTLPMLGLFFYSERGGPTTPKKRVPTHATSCLDPAEAGERAWRPEAAEAPPST